MDFLNLDISTITHPLIIGGALGTALGNYSNNKEKKMGMWIIGVTVPLAIGLQWLFLPQLVQLFSVVPFGGDFPYVLSFGAAYLITTFARLT